MRESGILVVEGLISNDRLLERAKENFRVNGWLGADVEASKDHDSRRLVEICLP